MLLLLLLLLLLTFYVVTNIQYWKQGAFMSQKHKSATPADNRNEYDIPIWF